MAQIRIPDGANQDSFDWKSHHVRLLPNAFDKASVGTLLVLHFVHQTILQFAVHLGKTTAPISDRK